MPGAEGSSFNSADAKRTVNPQVKKVEEKTCTVEEVKSESRRVSSNKGASRKESNEIDTAGDVASNNITPKASDSKADNNTPLENEVEHPGHKITEPLGETVKKREALNISSDEGSFQVGAQSKHQAQSEDGNAKGNAEKEDIQAELPLQTEKLEVPKVTHFSKNEAIESQENVGVDTPGQDEATPGGNDDVVLTNSNALNSLQNGENNEANEIPTERKNRVESINESANWAIHSQADNSSDDNEKTHKKNDSTEDDENANWAINSQADNSLDGNEKTQKKKDSTEDDMSTAERNNAEKSSEEETSNIGNDKNPTKESANFKHKGIASNAEWKFDVEQEGEAIDSSENGSCTSSSCKSTDPCWEISSNSEDEDWSGSEIDPNEEKSKCYTLYKEKVRSTQSCEYNSVDSDSLSGSNTENNETEYESFLSQVLPLSNKFIKFNQHGKEKQKDDEKSNGWFNEQNGEKIHVKRYHKSRHRKKEK